eukprot:1731799-Alexandrium_andersonii.AAC.1
MHSGGRTVADGPVGLSALLHADVDGGVASYAESAQELEADAFDLDWELQAALDEWLVVERASNGRPAG